jgi:uncharacterized HAD superfamily protein
MSKMKRPIIALDIDDVLAGSMTAVRLMVNKQLGVELQPEHYAVAGDYWGYYESIWASHGLAISFDDLDEKTLKDMYLPFEKAAPVLTKLAKHYRLVVITSRNENWRELTRQWSKQHFPGLISDIVFAGSKEHAIKRTKGEVCAELGAEWLIDDNLEHCIDAAKYGVQPILFGMYGWQRGAPEDMIRCKDWTAVEECFDGRKH